MTQTVPPFPPTVRPPTGEAEAGDAKLAGASEGRLTLRSDFLRRLGHDIASPAGVTLTVLEQMAAMERPKPELIAMARRNVKRLLRLAEQLSLVAESDGSPLVTEPRAADVGRTVQVAMDEAVLLEGRRHVTATLRGPTPALRAPLDARLVHTALREIISNALKCAATRVDVSVEAEDTCAVVRVEDDGDGFTPGAVKAMGRRLGQPTSRGLGLSLSLATDIVRAHEGTLSIGPRKAGSPGEGRGAQVVLRFPLDASRSDAPDLVAGR